MDFKTAVTACLSKYATFTGRAGRPEYWYFFLFALLVHFGTAIVDAVLFRGSFGPLNAIATLLLMLPLLAVGVRRLHDTGRAGWWMLLLLIPLIGSIVLIVWFCGRGEAQANRFGPPPAPISSP